ncbi:MAG: ABC transporter substrate-binding protein, partial [Pseudomonadota bacterium]
TFKLRQGVKWHDGKPFTSADVQCTFDTLIGKRDSHWRKSPRKQWYGNLKEVTVAGPYEVRLRLGRPQPSFLSFLASGWTAIYPCHVDGPVMRRKPIGTGPFKFVESGGTDLIRLVKNRDYWKPGRPYLDGIDSRVVHSMATRVLSFMAGEFDITGISDINSTNTVKDILKQAPKAICESTATPITSIMVINHKLPPFDNIKVRRAISLALDREAFAATTQGDGRVSGMMLSPPYGAWGLSPEQLAKVPGYGKNVERNRAEARKLMREAGYGPDNKLKTSYMVRLSIASGLIGGSLMADQLRSIYIEGDVEQKEYTIFQGAMMKGAYALGYHSTAAALDDPDVLFYERYTCTSMRNYSHYCNRETEAMIDEQSATVDPVKRKKLVQAIELKLQHDVAMPTLYMSTDKQCWYGKVKGFVKGANSIQTHLRMEDVWLDR